VGGGRRKSGGLVKDVKEAKARKKAVKRAAGKSRGNPEVLKRIRTKAQKMREEHPRKYAGGDGWRQAVAEAGAIVAKENEKKNK
jgi:hypothetical protein